MATLSPCAPLAFTCAPIAQILIRLVAKASKKQKRPKFWKFGRLNNKLAPKPIMDLITKIIKKPRTFKRIVGLTPSEFQQVVKKVKPSFRSKYVKLKKVKGSPNKIKGLENQLLCFLIYYRTYTTQFFMGLVFQVDAATVCRTIKRLEPLLAAKMKIKKNEKCPIKSCIR